MDGCQQKCLSREHGADQDKGDGDVKQSWRGRAADDLDHRSTVHHQHRQWQHARRRPNSINADHRSIANLTPQRTTVLLTVALWYCGQSIYPVRFETSHSLAVYFSSSIIAIIHFDRRRSLIADRKRNTYQSTARRTHTLPICTPLAAGSAQSSRGSPGRRHLSEQSPLARG